jgi:hypothetical protein
MNRCPKLSKCAPFEFDDCCFDDLSTICSRFLGHSRPPHYRKLSDRPRWSLSWPCTWKQRKGCKKKKVFVLERVLRGPGVLLVELIAFFEIAHEQKPADLHICGGLTDLYEVKIRSETRRRFYDRSGWGIKFEDIKVWRVWRLEPGAEWRFRLGLHSKRWVYITRCRERVRAFDSKHYCLLVLN